jgi:hypothetical protein
MYSTVMRLSLCECPWLPICVAIFGLSFAFFASARASSTDQQSGFCT